MEITSNCFWANSLVGRTFLHGICRCLLVPPTPKTRTCGTPCVKPDFLSGSVDSKLGLGGCIQIIAQFLRAAQGHRPLLSPAGTGAGLCGKWGHRVPAQASVTLDTGPQAWSFHCPGIMKAPAAAGAGGGWSQSIGGSGILGPHLSLAGAQFLQSGITLPPAFRQNPPGLRLRSQDGKLITASGRYIPFSEVGTTGAGPLLGRVCGGR